MPFGFKEVEGIHSRTNFDLSQHEKFSGKSIKYFDPELNESYTPYVIETSIGVDRMFLSIMSAAYCEEQLENGESRVVLKLPAALAPVKLAVMPLVKKDGLPEKAREIIDDLKFDFGFSDAVYDEIVVMQGKDNWVELNGNTMEHEVYTKEEFGNDLPENFEPVEAAMTFSSKHPGAANF